MLITKNFALLRKLYSLHPVQAKQYRFLFAQADFYTFPFLMCKIL